MREFVSAPRRTTAGRPQREPARHGARDLLFHKLSTDAALMRRPNWEPAAPVFRPAARVSAASPGVPPSTGGADVFPATWAAQPPAGGASRCEVLAAARSVRLVRAPEPGEWSPAGSARWPQPGSAASDRKSTRLNSSHTVISYAVFCLKKKNKEKQRGEIKNETKKKIADMKTETSS